MTLPRANRRLTLRTAAVLLALAALAILFVGAPTASADEPPSPPHADPPEAPRGLRVSPGGSGELVASWRAPYDDGGSSITGYKVQWKSGSEDYDDSVSSTRQAVITDPNRLGHTIRGLRSGTEYTVRVIATNSVGDGPPSLEESATTHPESDPEPGDEPDGSRGGYGQNGVYTWRDGDRVMRVRLEPGADKEAYGVRESDPVFRSESGGGVMTLPGGVLLALDPLWSASAVDQFFSQNSIKRNRVSPLGFLENAFFVETEPGFPSLDLANDLAEQDGVVISMPNWGMEVETHQTPPEDDDHGDTIDTATVLPLNTRMSGAINSDDDVDVFQFQVSESTLVAVGNFEEGEEGGLHPLVGNYFTIVDASEELVTRGFRNALVRLEAGTYYVKVDVWSLESRWEYDIEVRTIPDQGDTIAAAVPISVPNDQSHFAAIGDLTTSDDVDLFKIVVDTVTDVIIDPQFDDVKTVRAWTHTYIPINVNLLDASGDPAHRLANDGVDFDGRPYRLAAGTHYFRISAYQPDPHLRPYVLRLRESTEYAEFIDGCADITPDSIDPLHGCQWHLHNDEDNEGRPGNDINLGDVWQTTKGEGVNVAIIDETVESVHEDLGENWNADLSHNYLGEGQEASHFNDHGTAVAGIVAARDNGKGIIGVAPRASIVGYNILERPFSTFTLTLLDAVDAFTRNMEDIAVSNNSWGVPYLSYDVAPQLWTRALKAGATRGLDGKGVLYVFAAGNGHEIGQHPNLTGTRNSYLQTLACAVDSDGIREYYSEIDYVLWVCAPSANITTDNLNRYRQDFDGTSAAAPIVSGVAALVRSANPSLTWRDVKLILAGSARKTDPDNAGWEEGALKYGSDTERYSYNPEYGFGVVDATAAVELAQDWTTLPPFLNSSAETARTALPIPETENGSDPTPLASKLSVISHVNFIEFVEVHVSVVHPAFRELRITLESPSGTTSVLMPGEGTFEGEVGWWTHMEVPFRMGSARHLGEDPNGTWTLRVSDHWEDIEGILRGWSIKFYGHGDSTAIQRITGTAQVYETLTVDTSRIAVGLTGVEFTYQWLDDGGWWAGEFPGGTNDSYTPGINDTGRTFSVEVSFTDDRNFQSTRTSPPSAVIAPPDGIVWWAMLVGGSNNGAHGYNSFVNYGTLSPNAFSLGGNDYVVKALLSQRNGDVKLYLNQKIPGDFTLDVAGKRRFSSRDARGSEVTNPSKSYYYYTWVNAGFEFPSSDTGWWNRGQRYVIAMSMGLPTISGTALVGETLTAETSDIVDADGLANATFSYQWLADNQDIPGATGDSYSPVSSDVGKTIRVRVSFTDDADNEETLSSAPTAAVFFARPSAPQRLVVSPHGSGALDFHWEAPVSDGGSPITWYYARWKEAAGSWDTPADVSGILLWSTSYPHTITGLTDGVEYAVRVSARNYYSHFGPSAEAHGTPGEPTPPELTGAIVDGDTLVLNYDEDLDETSEPATDAFSVTVGGTGRAVDGVSVSGSSVILTLGSAVASGATVTVSYAAPTDAAAPRIQDDAGNPAASFSDEDVENNTPPPANTPATGAPTITGTAQVGDTLTASTSDIDDADGLDNVGYSYQWLANGAEITGATSSSYTLVDADAGLTIKVKVSFFDDKNNPETLTSAATTAVLANVPGAPEHLNVSLHDTGALDVSWGAPATDGGSAITEYRVQWKETAGNWDTPADVSEETVTGTTHTITGLTNGVEYAVRVIAVNDVGDGPPSDEATGTPRETTPPELSTATVDGTTMTLTHDEDLDENSEPSPDAFSVTVGGTGRAVDGVSVSGSSVILTLGSVVTSEDTVTVSYTVPTDAAAPRIQDDAGNPAASFSDQDVENNTPPPANAPATGAPTITGTAQVGDTLTADISGIGDADGLDNATFSYQWLADGTEVAGAMDPTYTLVAADENKTIKVRVTFTDDGGNQETLTSAATAAVDPDPGPITGFTVVDASDQSVEGTLADGGTLALDDPDGGSFGIRADLESGATIGSMRLELTGEKTHDQTENITPYSLYGDSGGNLSGESLPVGEYTLTATAYSEARLGGDLLGTLKVSFNVTGPATQQPNSPATGLPTISGTARVGETLTVNTSGIDDADGIGNATFSYQWIAGTTDIAGATDPTYTLVADDVGKAIKVRVSFMDGASNVETLTSGATATVVTPLTAEFQDAPDKHLGTGVFTFKISFSEPISISYKTLRDDSLEVTNGSATKAKRVDGQSDLWEITVEPDSNADVTVVLPVTGDCTTQDAVCTRDGTELSNRSELTVPGPAAANSPATGAPIISGTAQVGETLTVDTSGIDDADGMSGAVFSYQWLANDAEITGATGDTYTLVEADVGKAVKVRVIFNDDDDNEETLTSEATAAVAAEIAVPDAPRSLNVSPDDTGTLDVSWEAPASDGGSAITGYKVQWKSGSEDYDGSAGSTRQAEITDPASRTHTITGLTDGVEYAVRVIAVNDVGDGPPSDEATGTPRETTPPELSTATVDGTTLTLTYDEALDENSEPSPDAFSVAVGGTGRAVHGVSVSGSSVILALASAVTAADTVTVSYTAPTDAAAPRIQDEAGHPAASFSDQGVENNTPPPANTPATGAPTISGTAEVGKTLTASTSDIDDADGLDNVGYSYQWLANGADIAGATSSSYTLVEADKGKTIQVKVSFRDDKNNQETLTSEATASVEPRPNSPATGAPTISGTVRVGETLTAETSAIADADGLDNVGYSYQWLANGADIAGATSSSYTLADDDKGKTIQVKVSFRDDKNNPETLTSEATAAVEPRPNSPATGAPTISGTAQVGETLTVDTSGIADADGMSGAVFIYHWLADDADIAGATSDTYTLVDADVGKTIKVRVIFNDNADNEETLTSAATAAVEPRPNSPATGAPTISGTAQVGETLTVDTSGIADADGMSGAVFIYHWLADDADIAGATSDTYTLVDADVGKTIKVRVIFNDNADNEETLTSAATAAVEPRPNSPATGAPSISGTAQVGKTLTASTSDIDDADGMSKAVFSYQWLANGADVAGATSDTYTPVADDVDKAIKVKVSFRDDRNHQESLTSAATAAVTAAADESAVWSATLTVGSIAGYLGFWKDVGMGELTSEVFTLDGVDYTVKVLADSDGPQFYLTLDKALPVGFTLQVGATTLSSQDASIREFSSGATQYGWATNQEAVLEDVDIVEVSLTASD